MAKQQDNVTHYAEQLVNSFNDQNQFDRQTLLQLRDMQLFSRLLLKHEGKRLSARLGQDHPRVQAINASLQHKLDVIKDLDAKSEAATVKVPAANAEDVLFHGRVSDEHGQSIAAAKIVLVTDNGEDLPVEIKSTDHTGYFSAVLNPKLLEYTKGSAVRFKVLREDGQLLYEHKEAFNLTPGDHKLVRSVIKRDKVYTIRPAAKQAKTKPGSKQDKEDKTKYTGKETGKQLDAADKIKAGKRTTKVTKDTKRK